MTYLQYIILQLPPQKPVLEIVVVDLLVLMRTDHPPAEAQVALIKKDLPKIGVASTQVGIDRGQRVVPGRSHMKKKDRVVSSSTQML